jgi:hypothetical protein
MALKAPAGAPTEPKAMKMAEEKLQASQTSLKAQQNKQKQRKADQKEKQQKRTKKGDCVSHHDPCEPPSKKRKMALRSSKVRASRRSPTATQASLVMSGNKDEVCDESSADFPMPALLDVTIEEEGQRLIDSGYMTATDTYMIHEGRNSRPNLASSAGQIDAAEAVAKAPATKCQSATVQDCPAGFVNEKNYVNIWPPSRKACGICRARHLQIPGSSKSRHCIRISMFRGDRKSQVPQLPCHQSILVPTDPFEKNLLGWLIWSTYEQQVAAHGAVESPPGKKQKRKKVYLHTEFYRKGKELTSRRQDHGQGRLFADWWNGKKSFEEQDSRRWFVVTFPWDMGNLDNFDTSFGSMENLFRLPVPPLGQGVGDMMIHGEGTNGATKLQLKDSEHEKQVEGVGSSTVNGKLVDEEDEGNDSDGDYPEHPKPKKAEKRKRNRKPKNAPEGYQGEQKKGDDRLQNPAFLCYREHRSPSCADSS